MSNRISTVARGVAVAALAVVLPAAASVTLGGVAMAGGDTSTNGADGHAGTATATCRQQPAPQQQDPNAGQVSQCAIGGPGQASY